MKQHRSRLEIVRRLAKSRKARLSAVFAGTGLLIIVNLLDYAQFVLAHPRNADFFLYYLAAQIGLSKGWPAIYDPHVYLPALWHTSHRWLPYLNPPPMAWLAVPLTLLPFRIALGIWLAGMFAALLFAWRLLAPGRRLDRLAHLMAMLSLYLVQMLLRLGQVVGLLMAAVALSWWLIKRGKPVAAGMALGVMVLKPQTMLLVPVALLVAGYRRVFLGWLLVVVPLALLSLIAMGASGLQNFAASSVLVYHLPTKVTFFSANQVVPGPAAVAIGIVAFGLTVATAWRARGSGPELPIAVGLVGSMLVVPYLLVYDLTGLVLSAWLALRVGLSSWQKAVLLIGYLPLVLANADAATVSSLVVRCAWMVMLFTVSLGPAAARVPGQQPSIKPGPEARPTAA